MISLLRRGYRYDLGVSAAAVKIGFFGLFEVYNSVNRSIEGVVTATGYARAGKDLVAALANDDLPGRCFLAVVDLDAQPFTF